jgi:hypothetical protein
MIITKHDLRIARGLPLFPDVKLVECQGVVGSLERVAEQFNISRAHMRTWIRQGKARWVAVGEVRVL